ncbi:hypothetical protein SpCBS45565_g05282 [Spizellomyces sp. 'palustris']|uniref:Protein PET100, mitochondrial n=1 Tax=Spizellomyces punctatus (strain DAOM BR117) TaxID=645134 RepID=A0A0L0HVS4_SPIPD|nr:uncharacterized protein SPPG_08865 [Spizellomyces punctatus DAOM BR117]KND04979.1 hypothetical protein SPPG_08865 [Spizellomyces punctatus DAOM BR117]TPX65267.1 hypothetical protein SpCBS45565_g05282 [Spizellomyces sp. 'palustris']|eukprot:XP_016613018.1 hypothetical protein SPPG_08865 [Spizellomyces punctatus DAOM BR117]
MPLPRNFVRTEMLKFGVYIFFPIGVLYLFNRPELQEMLSREHQQTVESFKTPEEQLFKLPKSMEEVRQETARMRQHFKSKRESSETNSSA